MTDGVWLHKEVTLLLAGVGARYTTGRRALIEALADIGGPVTVEELLAHDPRLPSSSVYRNVSLLEAAGAVERVSVGDDRSRVELSQAIVGHHHHLVCNRCGRVDDQRLSDSQEAWLHQELADVAAAAGYQAQGHRIDIVGRCGSCLTTG